MLRDRRSKRTIAGGRIPVVAIALALSQGIALADGGDEPLVGDRPDFTESGSTVPAPAVQLEAGVTLTNLERGGDALEAGEALVRIGVGPRWELRLGPGSYVDVDTRDAEADGLSDASVGVKVRLDDPDSADETAWALIVDSTLDTGDDDIGADDPQPGAKLIYARELTERLQIAANANWRLVDDGDAKFDQLSGSVALAIGLADRWGGYVELFGFSEETDEGPSSTFANAGVTYLLRPELQLDARVGSGLGGTDVDLFVGVGVVKRW